MSRTSEVVFDSVRELLPSDRMDITFRLGIRIAYVTTILNRHSETVDRTLVLRNSILGQKLRHRVFVLIR
ncbi:hypothetical protein Taro_028121 [Colocasia esculenta]|uniref:Uncharacterized protein n=1 Tax=Colocasia esculenta TaxID=4460 RepID=A0A843VHM1_COLES|nr:hypothetical protein [Colocasia esculenta]